MEKGAYLTHVLPLRPYEQTLFIMQFQSRVLETISQLSPHHNHHHHYHLYVLNHKMGITRLKPGILKGLTLKKEGGNIVPK